jgi:hypothetical protein
MNSTMKNVVFTIIAENYLSLAQALYWSLKKYNKTPVEFVIFMTDRENVFELKNEQRYILTPISALKLDKIEDLTFKYNVTEFCTAVKPSCFKYLFNVLGVEKAIYFDPDIFVFNDILPILQNLEGKEVVITPHHLTPQYNVVSENTEMRRLFEGIYNFGFVACKKSDTTLSLLNWWEYKLRSCCYGDIQDALHTDQKWADFFPIYAKDNLLISRHIGYNFAPWNIFEREVFEQNDKFYVRNRFTKEEDQLIFVHFAGYDPNKLELIHKYLFDKTIRDYPEYNLIRNIYIEITNEFGFGEKKNLPYGFSTFTNGVLIRDYHRRLYRALTEEGNNLPNPFSHKDAFYKLLQKNRLIDKNNDLKRHIAHDLHKFDSKKKKIEMMCRILLRFIGAKRYFILMKFLNRFSRPENQTFLLGKSVQKFY